MCFPAPHAEGPKVTGRTDGRDGSLLPRLVVSWAGLVAVIGLLAGAVSVSAIMVEQSLRKSAVAEIRSRGELLGALISEGEFTSADVEAGILEPARVRMRARVDRLRQDGRIMGVELWTASGTLLFAYPDLGHDIELDEALAVRAGKSGVTIRRDHGAFSSDDVLTSLDFDGVPGPEAAVVTVLPASALDGRITAYRWRVAGGGAAVLSLLGLLLVLLRRRVLRQEYEAMHDPLTGLGNRSHLTALAARQRDGYAVVLLDLDGFKNVNDTLGHGAGDELLVQVARTLPGLVRDVDVVTRLGGDAFALLMPGLTAADRGPAQVAAALRRDLAAAGFTVAGIALDVQASLGVTVQHELGAAAASEALRQADVAMYRAKAMSTGVVVYNPEEDHHDRDRLALLGELRQAIPGEQLRLHYQPVMALLPGMSTPTLCSVEALIRWQHPTRGFLGPGSFLPVAEHTALIHELTAWVLNSAVAQAKAWCASGLDLPVAVNLSPRAISEDTVRQVLDVLDRHHLPADRLKLEITETAISDDPARTIAILRALRDAGVRISLDDFGAGSTSLAHLTDLPLTELKIDKSFIDWVTTSDDKAAVVSAVVELGHRLGLIVVAEGVESASISDKVIALGCDRGQGYYYSKPLAAAELTQWANERRVGPGDVVSEPVARPRVAAARGR